MWTDDSNFPSVEDDDISDDVPAHVEEWNTWWWKNTFSLKGLRYYQGYGGRESAVFSKVEDGRDEERSAA
jgi:hypothetical protein